jgi:hypothetical protein
MASLLVRRSGRSSDMRLHIASGFLVALAWWHSFVGNIFGIPGQTTAENGWAYTDPSLNCDDNGNNCAGSAKWADCCAIWGYGQNPSASNGH